MEALVKTEDKETGEVFVLPEFANDNTFFNVFMI